MMDKESFTRELAALLNKHSVENISNTPDFILADYLVGCLNAFNKASVRREQWFGQHLSIEVTPPEGAQ